eukprot:Anaeramoba_ignava/a356849_25.p1 GENE.a356849_25~~a356849_25.p1  ORF type:complete len:330 (+),score=99.62 a356849_25:258-1247(+)
MRNQNQNQLKILNNEEKAQFMELLFIQNINFPLIILEEIGSFNSETLCKDMIIIFAYHKKPLISLIEELVRKEVNSTTNISCLFRGKSESSKILSEMAKMFGRFHLKKSIGKTIQEIMDCNSAFEIYPEDGIQNDMNRENLIKIRDYSEELLHNIFSSISYMPVIYRIVCQILSEITFKKFPDEKTKYVVLSGFVFLRFICPSIVTPEQFGITNTTPTSTNRRALVLISKVIQSIANRAMFPEGSTMESLNDVVDSFIPQTKKFMERLLEPINIVQMKPNLSQESIPNFQPNEQVICLLKNYEEKKLICKKEINLQNMIDFEKKGMFVF